MANRQLMRENATNHKGGMMKKLGIIALVAFACFLTSTAEAGKPCASAHLGGADINLDGESAPPNNDANLSVGAILTCDGSVRGQLQDTWSGGDGIHGKVTCLIVDGTDAYISGIITKAKADFADLEGEAFFIRIRDNGKNNKHGDPDQASFVFTSPFGGDFDDTICYAMPDVELYDLNNGQATVK
jgi:hypothetical protein